MALIGEMQYLTIGNHTYSVRDIGYTCTEATTTFINGNITTMADSSPYAYFEMTNNIPDVSEITVTFNGTEYTCEQFDRGEENGSIYYKYGAPWNTQMQSYDFSVYPFGFDIYADYPMIFYTQNAGTYSLKVEYNQLVVETTSDFETAVNSVIPADPGKFIITFSGSGSNITADHTFDEITDAYLQGRVIEGRWSYYGADSIEIFNLVLFEAENFALFSKTFSEGTATPKYLTCNTYRINSDNTITQASYFGTDTDTKVTQTPLNGQNSSRGLLFSTGNGTSTLTDSVSTSNKLSWNDSAAILNIYDTSHSKSCNLQYDQIQFSKADSNYKWTLKAAQITNSRTYELPDKAGTIALTSDMPYVPTISLNGSSTTSASFYAPTSAGTSGYFLKSNGSGAPTWAAVSTTAAQIVRWS